MRLWVKVTIIQSPFPICENGINKKKSFQGQCENQQIDKCLALLHCELTFLGGICPLAEIHMLCAPVL